MSFYLSSLEPFAFRKTPEKQSRPFLLACDHASNHIPKSLGNLGLPDDELSRHIGWDIGAARVTELLADRLGSAAILGNYSRLVVDLNRGSDHPHFIPETSDGAVIPGNQRLSLEERSARQTILHEPYHQAVAEELLRLERQHAQVALVSIHSFTPQLRNDRKHRPWQVGLLWKHDQASFEALRDYLETHTDLLVGDNEPYSMHVHSCYTERRHTETQGRSSLMIEIRQDEIATESGQQRYADILSGFLETYNPAGILQNIDHTSQLRGLTAASIGR